MTYRLARFPVNLSDLQGLSPIASLFECDFSDSFVGIDEISTDVVHRAVPPLKTTEDA